MVTKMSDVGWYDVVYRISVLKKGNYGKSNRFCEIVGTQTV